MNKNKQIFELYIDYLVTSFSYTTATGLSTLLDEEISHDQITRFLSHKQFSSADLWKNVTQVKIHSLTSTLIIPLAAPLKVLICSIVFIIPMKQVFLLPLS